MPVPRFTQRDFDVLNIAGLEARMEALITHIRPKLNEIGQAFCPLLSVLCGEDMYPHVAKHARRTVHPPDDTWVAWSRNKRGYKAHPHFQVGLWSSHLFVQFAIIYECTHKEQFADQLAKHARQIYHDTPPHYVWSVDHMNPDGSVHRNMDLMAFEQIAHRLKHVKQAEVVCGMRVNREDAAKLTGAGWTGLIEQTFQQLLPLYRMAF